MRNAFMTLNDGEPHESGDDLQLDDEREDEGDNVRVGEQDIGMEEAFNDGEPLSDAGDWIEGDADFYDVEQAVAVLPEPSAHPGLAAAETEDTRSRWPPASDANDVSVFLAGLQAKREVPLAVFQDLLQYFDDNSTVVASAILAGELRNFRTLRDRAARSVPHVRMDAVFKDADGATVTFSGVRAYPQKEASNRGLRRQYVLYYVSLHSVIRFHMELHPDGILPAYFDLSVDGIPESKSGGRSVDVLSIRFAGCRVIYSLAILQPDRRGMGLADDITINHFLEEYGDAVVPLRYVIADAPKRAALSGLKQHSSLHACQYCKAQKTERAFPSTTIGAAKRTNDETRAAADSGLDEYGVKKPSPLRSIASLDIIRHIPAEKMHLCDLGVIRKIIQLSFKCPQFKAKQVPFQRADDTDLSQALERAASLPNFSRRTRALDTANYKAEEYRNLGVAYWPTVARTIPATARKVWLLTVFAYRAALLGDAEYARWKEKYDEPELYTQWYMLFEEVFGSQNCSYNPHTFHHLPEVRSLAPLTSTSAYAFENHYNYLKRSYRPGTASMGQQALSALLVAARHGHVCHQRRRVSGKATRKVDDSWCYIPEVGVVKVSEANADHIVGKPVATEAAHYVLPGLDFNDVCAFKLVEPVTYGLPTTYPTEDVAGKCVVVDGVASVLFWDLLEE